MKRKQLEKAALIYDRFSAGEVITDAKESKLLKRFLKYMSI